LRKLQKTFPTLRVGIYPGYGTLTVLFSAEEKDVVTKAKQHLIDAFATYVYDAPSGKIEEALHLKLIETKKTLAFAESCTGGMLAEKITALPGASDYFIGSIVAYSNHLKREWLAVKEGTLVQHGAVSKEVGCEMLAGMFKITGADYGIAVSGIAGPTGGSAEKPVGTVWAAYGARGEKPETVTFIAPGNRQTIILVAATRLLGMLWRHLQK
jgi:nicotinamide-nucleotide amidase